MTRCGYELQTTIGKSVAKLSCKEEFWTEVAEKVATRGRHARASTPTEPNIERQLIFKLSGLAVFGQRIMGINISHVFEQNTC